MSRAVWFGILVGALGAASPLRAADKNDLQALLGKEVIGPRLTQQEVEEYLLPRVPRMPALTTRDEWDKAAGQLRAAILERVVYRGEAAKWRDAKLRVEWLDTIPGGPGYRIKKLRYEALPGLWVPALLYEPEKLSGKVPVVLNVNGHDGNGKAAVYKQIRCINLAKRGLLALNVEWLGMGQLRGPGYAHGRMNQLDLCGTSGLAPFYLAMKRGLDVLLSLENADRERVAVTGLSGGGWQTIFLSALDTRVTLANPVAGYSSFLTRIKHHKDLGDSEQTPCDLATLADYTHLTALLAPRPTLLTYNAKDDCCFEAGYALQPLLDAAGPVFKLCGKDKLLRSHVNSDPGTHNYEKENREAFYRMIGDHFYPGDKKFDAAEIPCADEVKKKEDLAVDLPKENADFNRLALAVAKDLPRNAALPGDKGAAEKWLREQRPKLRGLVRAKDDAVKAEKLGTDSAGGVAAAYWRLKVGDAWTLPVVELTQGEPKSTVLLIQDGGRKGDLDLAGKLLAAGHRVLAVDLFYFGEAKVEKRDYLFALLVAAVGERPLGIQAGQLAAAARWAAAEFKALPGVVASSPRSGVIALVAAGVEDKAIGRLELHQGPGSLKEIIERNTSVEQMPELFCFGLLESFDVKQLVALAAPRPVRFVQPGDRAKKELAGLADWYKTLGSEFDPLR